MNRSNVPLEQFSVQFDPDMLEDPKKGREQLVTALRFMQKDILPKAEKLQSQLPLQDDIENHTLRTSEDGRTLLHTKNVAENFTRNKKTHLSRYLTKATRGLSRADAMYVSALANRYLCDILAEIDTVATLAHRRFQDVVEGVEQSPEDENEVEAAFREAGENPNKRLDRLIIR